MARAGRLGAAGIVWIAAGALVALAAGGGPVAQAGGEAGAAPASPAPPPEVKKINDEIQRRFRAARDLSTADLVKEAAAIRELIEQLRGIDPNNPKIAEYERKIEKMLADARAADVRDAKREIDLRVSKIRMYLERNNEAERPQLKEQRDLLARALSEHRAALEGAGDAGKELIASTEAALKEADAAIGGALAGDALANEWVARLSAFHRNGAKDLTTPIRGAAPYAQVKAWRAEAQAAWQAYQKVVFEKGKTKELERAEEFFRQSMAEADTNVEDAVASRRKAAAEKVRYVTEYFAADAEWKQDAAKPPKRFADEMIEEARLAVEDLAAYVPGDAAVEGLRAEVEALAKENAARRKAGAALTFLRAEAYRGADLEDLRAVALGLVPKEHPGAQALRATIFPAAWKEETVAEWTDTTKTAWRVRTTRTLMFSAACKDKDGVFRDFGYLNQDRQSDGSWGPTYGHMTRRRAPMPEANVAKDEP